MVLQDCSRRLICFHVAHFPRRVSTLSNFCVAYAYYNNTLLYMDAALWVSRDHTTPTLRQFRRLFARSLDGRLMQRIVHLSGL